MPADTSIEHALPAESDATAVVWLRPEYQGRENELVTFADGADEVGVSRSTVSNWVKRKGNFPKLVLLTGSPRKRTKYVVRKEFHDFARIQLNTPARPRGGDRRPHRPSTQIASEVAMHCEQVLGKLKEREERQAQALKRTRSARRTVEKKLAKARARRDAEIAAVVELSTATEDPE